MSRKLTHTGMLKVTLTAADCRALLKNIPPEYRWKKNNYNKILADMKADRFDSMASAPFAIDDNLDVWNGRHRMQAQADLGKTYTYWVNRCTPEEGRRIQALGDAPSPWSTQDELKRGGEADVYGLSSALTYLFRFREPGQLTSRQAPSPAVAGAILLANPEIRRYTELTHKTARRLGISAGMCATVAYVTHILGVPDSEIVLFWTQLDRLVSRDPAEVHDAMEQAMSEGYAIRDAGGRQTRQYPQAAFVRWLKLTQPSRAMAVRRSELVTWVYLHKAWNAWNAGKPVGTFKWIDNEEFPPLRGPFGKLYPGSPEAGKLLGG